MPAVSDKQQRLIYVKRNQYKTKDKAPEEWQWVFSKDWDAPKKESYMKKYIRFFTEMSPPNFSFIKSSVEKEANKRKMLSRTNRELKVYHLAYRDYLIDYLDGKVSPPEVAELAKNKADVDDNSYESAQIDASQFIMNIVRKSIED